MNHRDQARQFQGEEHPNRDTLWDCALGNLPAGALESVVNHVEACTTCQAVLATFGNAEESMVSILRQAVRAAQPTITLRWGDGPGQADEAAPANSPHAAPPQQLGEYELLDKLGQGGMGAVYRARHTKLKRIVALKVLPASKTLDDRAIARFEREMEAVGQLDCPHIVRAHDAREVDGTHFLVMEYVEGVNVSKLVERLGPLPIADACEIVRQAALGLQYAHQRGLVHRDIKPSNLMLTPGGQVKILDLGLALLDGGEGDEFGELTTTGMAMGTADYMAPEQASNSHLTDTRADIYSLGCALYKLLSGRLPFAGPNYRGCLEKIAGHLRDAPAPIGTLRADVPRELIAVLDRMLAKNRDARFATPQQVVEAMAALTVGADLMRLCSAAMEAPLKTRHHDYSSADIARNSMSTISDTPSSLAAKPDSQAKAKRSATTDASPLGQDFSRQKARLSTAMQRAVLRPRVLIASGMLGLALLAGSVVLKIRYPDGRETVLDLSEGSKSKLNTDGSAEVTLPNNGSDVHNPTSVAKAAPAVRRSPGPAEGALPGIIPRPADIAGTHRSQVPGGTGKGELIERRGGMIYDSDLNITWLRDAKYVKTSGVNATGQLPWNEAKAWVENLVYAGFDDWRLPKSPPPPDPTGSGTWNLGELAHLYYTELGNKTFSFTNSGPFVNLDYREFRDIYAGDVYWMSTEHPLNADWAWWFGFSCGLWYPDPKARGFTVWPVRDGDVIPHFSASAFEPPMGNTIKLGSTITVKFRLFRDEARVISQTVLDSILAEFKLQPACPQIQVFDMTSPGNPLGPISVCRKVGRKSNDRFGFTAAGECTFDLPLEGPDIKSGRKYLTQVKIGELVVQPGNPFFFTPKTEGGTK